jgi:hypothetical protein
MLTLSVSVAVKINVLVGELVRSITLLGEAEKLAITGASESLAIRYIYICSEGLFAIISNTFDIIFDVKGRSIV